MEFIRQANLAKARECLTDTTAFLRDRAGRSPLHMATLFERRFVIKYLVKSYPASVHIKDDVSIDGVMGMIHRKFHWSEFFTKIINNVLK